MQIDLSKPAGDYVGFLPFIVGEERDKLIKAAQELHGSYWSLSVGRFFECSKGVFKHIGIESNDEPITTGQYLWVLGFKDFLELVAKVSKKYDVPQTADEKRAAAGCLQLTPYESVIVFLQSFFGLHSFDEAEERSMLEYITARKAVYNKAVFEKRMAQIQRAKYKKK